MEATTRPVKKRLTVGSADWDAFYATKPYKGKVAIKGLERHARTAFYADGSLAGTLIFVPGFALADLKDE